MKKLLKKIFTMVLTSSMVVGSITVFVYANTIEDVEEKILTETNMLLEEKKEIFGDIDGLENATIYIANDVEEAKRIYNIQTENENREQKEQKLEKIDEKIYVLEEFNEISPHATTPEMKIVVNETSYNKSSEVLNKSSSYGMRYWVDLTFNLVLGSKTKHLWKPATVLGLTPSKLLSEWQEGDMLEKEESMILREKWIQVKEKDGYISAGHARKEDITLYVDLRTTIQVNGQLENYKKSAEKDFVNITPNYNNNSVLKSKASEVVLDGHVLSFYEDPWS